MTKAHGQSEGGGRRIALVAAAALTVVAITIVTWSVVSTRSPGATDGDVAPEPQLQPIDNTITATNGTSSRVGAVEDLLGPAVEGSEQGRIEFVDEDGRIVRELLYETLEPREGGRIEVDQPQAWMHLSNGGVAHLQANHGSLLQPQGRREPESGRFEGEVRVRVFDEDPRPREDIAPAVTFATDTLSFDTTMGELRTTDHVQITAAGLAIEFTGFTLIIDEVHSRLSLFQTNSAGSAVIDPSQLAESKSDESESGNESSSPVAAVIESLYHAAMTGNVTIEFGPRVATAERFDLWARLLDNRPTPRTIEGLRLLSPPRDETATGESSIDQPSDPGENDVLTITWTNGLTIQPRDDTPVELQEEDAFARLASPTRGIVRVEDEITQLSTTSVALEYAIASRNLLWTGVGPRGVVMRAEELFEATTNRFELDLATGDATFPGPGVIVSLAEPVAASLDKPLTPAQILWRDRAYLSLARSEFGIDFSANPLLIRSQFYGAVQASNEGVVVTGEQVQSFYALNRAGQTTIARAVVMGEARVDAGVEGLLTANRLDIEFDLDADAVAPTIATAQGDVRAAREGSTLRADLAEATFVRDISGRSRVDAFSADLGVVVQTADGVRMTADSLNADPERSIADLIGEPAEISFGASAISGAEMRINQTERTLTVFGNGALRRSTADDGLGYENLLLEWADSMRYDDLIGEALFLGECVLTADVSDLARDVVTAGRIELSTTPYAERQERQDNDQSIRRAVAYGASSGVDSVNLARVESRRYIRDETAPGNLRLTRLVYLDGPEIIADVTDGELQVPHPGKLLIENRRLDEAASGGNAQTDLRGTTLVEWDGAFVLKREVGAAEFRRQVRVRYRPLGAPRVTELECERLDLSFDPDAQTNASAGSADLLWAQAQGAVYAAQGRRQVVADRMLFDNALGFAELTAWPGNAVTLFDADAPTPLTGDLLRWDLLRDRVEWRGARPTAAPD